jgi:hypothetical protein
MDSNRPNRKPMVSTTSHDRQPTEGGGLAPMALINGRYYVPDGCLHCWPGRTGSNGAENEEFLTKSFWYWTSFSAKRIPSAG